MLRYTICKNHEQHIDIKIGAVQFRGSFFFRLRNTTAKMGANPNAINAEPADAIADC